MKSHPFRADHVGSLLRPDKITTNRLLWKQGKLPSDALRQIENEAIAQTVKKVESIGIQSITDGDFAPLRFVPPHKKVVLGIISSKTAKLEDTDDLCRRIDEAAQYIPLENMCISPQCGFSSTHHGNDLTHDDQWRKLELVVNVAQKVWGDMTYGEKTKPLTN